MKSMETVQDLVEEAKVRTVYWVLCVFSLCYFLSHTSNSMWINIPISLLMVSAMRILVNKVEFRWRVHSVCHPTYLSYLEKKQLSVNDPRLSTSPPPRKWQGKIGSPIVEAAATEFIDKLLQDFVLDLWYSDITPDKEAPELIHAIIMDALCEMSGRLKELNLFDLLTRDAVDIIGDHLELFRRNQLAIGHDVMSMLSTEERDDRLKHHLSDSRELHPALISPECEYKVLQKLAGGVLGVVLRPREAQCPLVRCIARELLASLVLQPVMNFACPEYINELVEYLILSVKDDRTKMAGVQHTADKIGCQNNFSIVSRGVVENSEASSNDRGKPITKVNSQIEKSLHGSMASSSHAVHDRPCLPRPADWARVLDAATQRRTEVLMPENLENMWCRGKNYKFKGRNGGVQVSRSSRINSCAPFGEELLTNRLGFSDRENDTVKLLTHSSEDLNREVSVENAGILSPGVNKCGLKRSSSTSALKGQRNLSLASSGQGGGPIISEFYGLDSSSCEVRCVNPNSDQVLHEAARPPKLKCRVKGAYFEKIGSQSFAVYSITVTDAENMTWSVKRRYRNFERLHRHLKEIPNYTLHLPPKRIFSSSTEDAFVHQRCVQLDKYLQDLLSIANVAEQHEVWDFLSITSKNYSFGKSSSMMKTLAVNVDDAVDDIVRQFREVSGGFKRRVVGSSHHEGHPSISSGNLSWHADDTSNNILLQNCIDTENISSDKEEGSEVESLGLKEFEDPAQDEGWHSENELSHKSSQVKSFDHGNHNSTDLKSEIFTALGNPSTSSSALSALSERLNDPVGVPPEWTPPNVSVPLLNLVDKIFQLQRRGWLRRQVFWISKQILQLVMEDAIDDFLLRQIHWLRRDDVIAQGIRWVQDVLWPNGTFFLNFSKTESNMDDSAPAERPPEATNRSAGSSSSPNSGSFEAQLEASRRASDVKKMIFDGPPAALVSLIGYKQYRRCAKDVYYFLQSTVCVKQLAYGMLELVIISVFPELRELVIDIHKKMQGRPR